MKNVLFLILLISINISAQETKSFIYSIDDKPLEKVLVKNIKSNQQSFSDDSGYFTINGYDTDTIRFTLKGFSQTDLTVKNIINSSNKIYLFPQREYLLPEVTVTPINMYALYEKAIANLKNKLIKNKDITYQCIGTEKEVNIGDERSLDFLFSAKLTRADVGASNLNYVFSMSKLNIKSDAQNSDIMKDNKFRIFLFNRYLKKTIKLSDKNSIQISDSVIIICDSSNNEGTYTYTINRNDTTITQVAYELIERKNGYTRRRTFKGKDLYKSFLIQFESKDDSYYLSNLDLNFDTSFLTGKPEREERLICKYKISAIPDLVLNTKLKFTPSTQSLYKMQNIE